jgi:hypothetical protein
MTSTYQQFKRRAERFMGLGLCRYCGRPVGERSFDGLPGKLCGRHLMLGARRQKRHRERRKAA